MATVDLGTAKAQGQGTAFGALSYSYTWQTKATMPGNRDGGFLCAYNGYLYYLGGSTNEGATGAVSTVYKYDPTLNTWSTLTSFTTPRCYGSGGVYNGKAYIIGGYTTSGAILNSVLQYDLTTGVSSNLSMSSLGSTIISASGVLDGKIYLTVNYANLYVYDMALNTFTAKATDAATSFGESTGVFAPDGKFHVVGGNISQYLHRVYDPVANTWASGTAYPSPGVYLLPAMVSYGSLMYVLGGRHYDTATQSSTVRTFDPVLNTWSTVASLPSPRMYVGQGAAMIGSTMYFAGGWDNNIGGPNNNLWALRVPELDLGTSKAMGQGFAVGYADMVGTAQGEGFAEAGDLQVRWSGKQVYAGGMIPVSGQRLIDYETDRSPIR